MPFIECRPDNRSPGPIYGPVRMDKKTTASWVAANYVLCRGAKAVHIHVYTDVAGAQTFSSSNPRIYQSAASVLSTGAVARSGMALDIGLSGDVNEGLIATYTAIIGPRIPVYAVSLHAVVSAEVTDLIWDAYVEW